MLGSLSPYAQRAGLPMAFVVYLEETKRPLSKRCRRLLDTPIPEWQSKLLHNGETAMGLWPVGGLRHKLWNGHRGVHYKRWLGG